MFWAIRHFPACEYHVFLSHCAEDRADLVHPVHRLLGAAGVAAWLDRHDYPYGRPSRAALRDAILVCRHVIFFVTDAMLSQARGWCVQELAWAELLQDNLSVPGGAAQNVVLPLFFVAPDDPRLPRSVWQAPRDRGIFCPGGRRPEWAAEQVTQFLTREQRLAETMRRAHRREPVLRSAVAAPSGLRGRVTRFDPQPLPPAR